MKTSMAAETRIIAPVRVFPYALALSPSLSLFVQGVTVKTTRTQTGSFRHGWRERRRETGRREETRVLHRFSLSLHPYRAFVREPSLPDLWRPSIRHYLWPRGLESLPKEAVPSSLAPCQHLSVSIFSSSPRKSRSQRRFADNTRLRQRERVYARPYRIRQWIHFRRCE